MRTVLARETEKRKKSWRSPDLNQSGVNGYVCGTSEPVNTQAWMDTMIERDTFE
jgi:hypothetical protein